MIESNRGIATLEKNIVLLLNKLKDNHYELESLRQQLKDTKGLQTKLDEENKHLKEQNDSLSMANSLLGSESSNITTKNKNDVLIQQIDACIDELQHIN